MKKLMLFAACAGLIFASCSNDDKVAPNQELAKEAKTPVSFGLYLNNSSTVTRAAALAPGGYTSVGLFAFEQELSPLSTYSKSNFMPNFMFNQKLDYDAANAVWTYSPIKYWPNNFGAMVSYFAYAPYVPEFSDDAYITTPETNTYIQDKKTVGTTGTRLNLSYDYNGPCIEYNVPEDPTEGVDLMWGSDKNYLTAHTPAPTPTAEVVCPYDYNKQTINGKVEFQMKHALSRLDFNVEVWTDQVNGTPSNNPIDNNTNVYVKQVSLKGQFPSKGSLHLYNGKWSTINSDNKEVLLTSNYFTSEINNGISGSEGQTAQPLLNNPANNYLMLIPGSQFKIEIVYDVVTIDSNNEKNNSTVTNTITSEDSYILEQGKAYVFNLRIGLTSVKFDVDTSEDWETPAVSHDVDLPMNTQAVTGVSLNLTNYNTSVSADNFALIATVAPANATNKNVIWTSSNPSVATVDNGVVSPVSAGTAIITATTEDGGFTDSCTVTVG